MDLLQSMNLDDLPEQQTRTVELMERYPDFDGRLGFDCCCHCGTSLEQPSSSSSPSSSSPAVVSCPSCRRVKYCSEACRIADASVATTVMLMDDDRHDDDDDNSMNGDAAGDTAMGHSAVVCALLSLCDDDEAVESGQLKTATAIGGDRKRLEAARDRVRSEDESYPATLANVLAEGPCYQHVIARRSRRRRPNASSNSNETSNTLVLHVVGASVDSELWGGFDLDADLSTSGSSNDVEEGAAVPCLQAYAEALAELNVTDIELVFVGPECPSTNLDRRVPMKRVNEADDDGNDTGSGELVVRSIQGMYSAELLESNGATARPDIVVFFNPGFTVPDYEWRDTLAAFHAGTPFLLATNTELEGIADCQYLLEQDKIQSLPPGLADVLGLYSAPDDDDNDHSASNPHETSGGSAFFSVNPFSGNRVRQSGTMANDLYVKNRWILGGVMDQFDPSRRVSSSTNAGGASTMFGGKKKQRRDPDGSSENTKLNNPALI